MLNVADWERVKNHFLELVDLPLPVREQQLCKLDLPLHLEEELQLMFKGADQENSPLDEPLLQLQQYPQSLGAYRLTREIGRGGMGVVYEAERETGDFEQRLAVKLLKRGLDTDEILARFHKERSILASLEHPHIARMTDGGSTADGRPYFFMELVPGEPVHRFCEQQQLNMRARLELFVTICRAVSFAHRRLVVHCDLKPENILVTEEGLPKLLDFGVARLLDPDGSGTLFTQPAMTPEYAAPEMLRGERPTVACDVYALGIILYAMLCGRRPYHFEDRLPERILQTLSGNAPPRLGQVADDKQPFPKDLELLALKAIALDPEQRYGSVDELVGDVDRFLNDRPVRVKGLGPIYRFRKRIWRQRNWWGSGAIIVLMLLFFGIRLHQHNQELMESEARLTHVVDLLISLFDQDYYPGGASPTPSQLLELALARQTPLRDALLEAAEKSALGRAHLKLEHPETARALLKEARDLLVEAGRDSSRLGTDTNLALGEAALSLGDFQMAEQCYKGVLAHSREGSLQWYEVTARLADLSLFQGRIDEGMSLMKTAMVGLKKFPVSKLSAYVQQRYALCLAQKKQGVQALALAESAHEDLLGLYGTRDAHTAFATYTIGRIHLMNEDLAQAEEHLLLARETMSAFAGRANDLASVNYFLARLATKKKRWNEAITYHRLAIERYTENYGQNNPILANPYYQLAMVLRNQGEHEASCQAFQKALDALAQMKGAQVSLGDEIRTVADCFETE